MEPSWRCLAKNYTFSTSDTDSFNGRAKTNDEGLAPFFTEIERILKLRPLAPISDNSDDLDALTPNSLLFARLDASLQMHEFIKSDGYRKNWRVVGWWSDRFWKRWVKKYIGPLQKVV